MKGLQTIQVIFDLPLRPDQIPLFKKEILHLQNPSDDIWHNHVVDENNNDSALKQGKNYRRYPQIQFRAERFHGENHACIWAVNEGVDALMHFVMAKVQHYFHWKGEPHPLNVLKIEESDRFENLNPSHSDEWAYSLTHFVPFNEQRYKEFKATHLFKDKLVLIEKMVLDNLDLLQEELMETKANMDEFRINTLDLKGFKTVGYQPKKSKSKLNYVALDMIVGINAMIPSGISIGNLKSLGYGILRPLRR